MRTLPQELQQQLMAPGQPTSQLNSMCDCHLKRLSTPCCDAHFALRVDVAQEQADLQAALDTQDSSSKQQSLESQLLQQLQTHLTHLKQQQRRLTASQD
jgi:hypothetical protein